MLSSFPALSCLIMSKSKKKQWKASVKGELWHIFCYIQPWIPAGGMEHYCMCDHQWEGTSVIQGGGTPLWLRLWWVEQCELSQIRLHGEPVKFTNGFSKILFHTDNWITGWGGGAVEGGCCCRGRRQTGDVLLFVVTLDSSSCTKEWLRTRKTMSYQGARL